MLSVFGCSVSLPAPLSQVSVCWESSNDVMNVNESTPVTWKKPPKEEKRCCSTFVKELKWRPLCVLLDLRFLLCCRHCPMNYTCIRVGENPNHGYTNFDNFLWSMLTTFQLITLDYWENVYNMVSEVFTS